MATYLDASVKKLEEFEGSIPWMYRDTRGYVTVGVGLMLPDSDAAVKLPFALAGSAATEAAIRAEFARVDALPMGRPALFYRGANRPELAKAEIDSLLRTVLAGFENTLRTSLAGYDGLPDNVKLALLDMMYNLGPAGLLHGFPKLLKAVETGCLGAGGGGVRAARPGSGTQCVDAGHVSQQRGGGGEGGGGKCLEAAWIRAAGGRRGTCGEAARTALNLVQCAEHFAKNISMQSVGASRTICSFGPLTEVTQTSGMRNGADLLAGEWRMAREYPT